MPRKDQIDAFGAVALLGFSALMGVNHVVAKVVNDGLGPVFFAGLRSAGAILGVWLLLRLRGYSRILRAESVGPGLFIGCAFAAEFLFLFTALDLTTVSRVSVIFYTMPVWLAVAGHWLLPGEEMTRRKAAGLALAVAGVAWALTDRESGNVRGAASLVGDLCALAAGMCWAGIALIARGTRLSQEPADVQLFWQVLVSAPILLLAAPLLGPLLRDPDWTTWAGLSFQIVGVVTVGFALWLWLLSIYPAAAVAAFGFTTPFFGVAFGWALLGEPVSLSLLGALGLVAAGVWLISVPGRAATPLRL